MTGTGRARLGALALVMTTVAACVPVTVNISFPQEKLESAARQIEDMPAQPAGTRPPASTPTPPPASGSGSASASGRTVDVTPRLDTRAPEVVKATESRRQRRPALREWKNRGCIGETNQGFLVARPGDGCEAEVAELIRAENADRQVIYNTFIKENKIPASDLARVQNAFAKARQERARPNDWIQLDDGQWMRKS
jgi:uncharacterized protein YdbL (DUF1318 family)